mgnify:CR=1 FL=1
MLMAFGITTVDARRVISTDLKGAGHRIYLVRHTPLENYMPDTAQLKENFAFVSDAIASGKVLAAWSVGFGGVAEGLAKMAFGNGIGVETTMEEARLYEYAYGSILVECEGTLEYPFAEQVGVTVADEALTVGGVRMPLEELYRANTERFATVYPDKGINSAEVMTAAPATGCVAYPGDAVEHPRVYIPVFPRHELRLRHRQGVPHGGRRGLHERALQPRGRRHPAFDRRDEGAHPPGAYLRAERRFLGGRRAGWKCEIHRECSE